MDVHNLSKKNELLFYRLRYKYLNVQGNPELKKNEIVRSDEERKKTVVVITVLERSVNEKEKENVRSTLEGWTPESIRRMEWVQIS